MKKTQKKSLHQCLLVAMSSYDDSLLEEQGGFILKENDQDNYEFVSVSNEITGTPRAISLYIANTQEFNNRVALRTLDDAWCVYASYHTHPVGMRALPSSIDLNMLFTSFPTNFIYAPERELNRFDYDNNDPDYSWKKTRIAVFYGAIENCDSRNIWLSHCDG